MDKKNKNAKKEEELIFMQNFMKSNQQLNTPTLQTREKRPIPKLQIGASQFKQQQQEKINNNIGIDKPIPSKEKTTDRLKRESQNPFKDEMEFMNSNNDLNQNSGELNEIKLQIPSLQTKNNISQKNIPLDQSPVKKLNESGSQQRTSSKRRSKYIGSPKKELQKQKGMEGNFGDMSSRDVLKTDKPILSPNQQHQQNQKQGKQDIVQEINIKERPKPQKKLFLSYMALMQGKKIIPEYSQAIQQYFHSGEHQLPQYLSETDFHIGDMVIQFPNPDHSKYNDSINISTKNCEDFFKRAFGHFDASSTKLLYENQIFHLAFMKTFQTLETPNENKARLKNWKQIVKNALKGNIQNQIDENLTSQQSQGNDNKLQNLDELTELEKQQQQQILANKKQNKQISQGGFFMPEQLKENKTWFKSSIKTKDFMTLVRIATWIKLISNGFHLRNFLSKDGQSIFSVVYVEDENLKIAAEKENLQKCLNLELSDLISLEPVDRTNRPLRLNTHLWHDEEDEEDQNDDVIKEDQEGEDEEDEDDQEILNGSDSNFNSDSDSDDEEKQDGNNSNESEIQETKKQKNNNNQIKLSKWGNQKQDESDSQSESSNNSIKLEENKNKDVRIPIQQNRTQHFQRNQQKSQTSALMFKPPPKLIKLKKGSESDIKEADEKEEETPALNQYPKLFNRISQQGKKPETPSELLSGEKPDKMGSSSKRMSGSRKMLSVQKNSSQTQIDLQEDKKLQKQKSSLGKLKSFTKSLTSTVSSNIQKQMAKLKKDKKEQEKIDKKEEEEKQQKHKQSEKFKLLKPKIQDLITQIDFKRLFRETNTSQLNPQILEVSETKVIQDEFLPDQVWELYYKYLKILYTRVIKLRKEYQFDTLYAQIVNHGYSKKQKDDKMIDKLLKGDANVSQFQSLHTMDGKSMMDELNISSIQGNQLFMSNAQSPMIGQGQVRSFFNQKSNISNKSNITNVTQQHQYQDLLQVPGQSIIKKQSEINQLYQSSDSQPSLLKSQDKTPSNNDTSKYSFNQQKSRDLQQKTDQEIIGIVNEQRQLSQQGETEYALVVSQNQKINEKRSAIKNKNVKNKNLTLGQQRKVKMQEQENQKKENNLRKQQLKKTLEKQFSGIDMQKNKFIQQIRERKEQNLTAQQLEEQDLSAQFQFKYKTFKQLLHLKSHKKLHTKYVKIRKKGIIGFEYKKLLLKTLETVNKKVQKKERKLENIWDILQIEPVESYVDYFQTPKNISFKKKSKLNAIWKNYQITENGRTSLFSCMERIKLVNKIVENSANMQYLIENNYVTQVFALNDSYELFGKSVQPLFQKIFQPKKVGATWGKMQNKIGGGKFKLAMKSGLLKKKDEEQEDQEEQKNDSSNVTTDFDQIKFLEQLISNKNGYNQQEAVQIEKKINQLDLKDRNLKLIMKEEFTQSRQFTKLTKTSIKQLIQQMSFKKQQKNDELELQKHDLRKKFYDISETQFVERKLKNLVEQWKFQIKQPWYIPVKSITYYYGEKIGLYFEFLGYYTKSLIQISIIGIAVWVLQMYYSDKEQEYVISGIVFGFLTTCWSSITLFGWKRQEKVFSIRFGQGQSKGGQEDVEISKNERPGFQGKYRRSITSDNLNEMYYPQLLKYIRTIGVILVCVTVMTGYFFIIWLLFIFSAYLDEEINGFKENQDGEVVSKSDLNQTVQLLNFPITLPALSNVLLLKIFEDIFSLLSTKLTIYENHQSMQDYRDNYIIKKFMFQFSALSGPLLLIYYVNDLAGFHCVQNDCFIHSKYHFGTIFCFLFFLNFWEIVYPLVKFKILKSKKDDEGNDKEKSEKEKDKKGKNKKNSKDKNQEESPLMHKEEDPFCDINEFIEVESIKDQYMESAEIYGTVDDYIEICIQYALLILFGIAFPLGFFIAIVWNIMELQTDKMKLIKYTQRPIPMPEATIGSWLNILELAGYIAIVSNSALISYTSLRMEDFPFDPLQMFLSLLILNFIIKFILDTTVGDMPENIKMLAKRHGYILNSTIREYKKISEKQEKEEDSDQENQEDNGQQKIKFTKKQKKKVQIFKIFGSDLEEIEKQQEREEQGPLMDYYEDLSTGSEIDDDDNENEEDLSPKNEEDEILIKKKKISQKERKKIEQRELNKQKKLQGRNLWMSSKLYVEQGHISRPVLKRFLFDETYLQYKYKHESVLRQELYDQGVQEDEINKKLEKKMKKTYMVPVKGVWFNGFRKQTQLLHPQETLQLVKDQKKKNIIEKEQENREQKVEIDLKHMTAKMLNQYFAPLGKKNIINLSDLRKQKWERLLIQLQSVSLKRMFMVKNPTETYAIPFCEDKLFSEMDFWNIQKDYLVGEIYCQLHKYRYTLLGKVYSSKTEDRWMILKEDRDMSKKIEDIQLLVRTKIDIDDTMHFYYLQRYDQHFRTLTQENQHDLAILENSFCLQKNMISQMEGKYGQFFQIYNEVYICNLQDALQNRQKTNTNYEEGEFMNIIQNVATQLYKIHQKKLYHGNVHPRNLILTEDKPWKYRLMGYMNLYQYDLKDKKVYFHRKKNDDESYYIANEISQAVNYAPKTQLNPQKSDIYSLGILILDIYHLGKFQEIFDDKEVGQRFDVYFQIVEQQVQHLFITKNLIQLAKSIILETNPQNRKSTREILIELKGYDNYRVQENEKFLIQKRNQHFMSKFSFTAQDALEKIQVNLDLRFYRENILFIDQCIKSSETISDQLDVQQQELKELNLKFGSKVIISEDFENSEESELEEEQNSKNYQLQKQLSLQKKISIKLEKQKQSIIELEKEKFSKLNPVLKSNKSQLFSKQTTTENDKKFMERRIRESQSFYTSGNQRIMFQKTQPTLILTKFQERQLYLYEAITHFGLENYQNINDCFRKNSRYFNIDLELFVLPLQDKKWNFPIVREQQDLEEIRQKNQELKEKLGVKDDSQIENLSQGDSSDSNSNESEQQEQQNSLNKESQNYLGDDLTHKSQTDQLFTEYSESRQLKTSRQQQGSQENLTDEESKINQEEIRRAQYIQQMQNEERDYRGEQNIQNKLQKYQFIYVKLYNEFLNQQDKEKFNVLIDNLEYMLFHLFSMYFKNITDDDNELKLQILRFSVQLIALMTKIKSDSGEAKKSNQDLTQLIEYIEDPQSYFFLKKEIIEHQVQIWLQEITLLICQNYIFLKKDGEALNQMNKLKNPQPNYEKCVFKLKDLLIVNSFKCDLLLEKEDDEAFTNEYKNFKVMSTKIIKGNNIFSFYFDILETYLHLLEFDSEQDTILNLMNDCIEAWGQRNNIQQHPLKDYLQGIILSKQESAKSNAIKLLVRCLNEIESGENKYVFQKMFVPKIRILENLFYCAKKNENLDSLFEKFEEIIKLKPTRPGKTNSVIKEKYAQIYFVRDEFKMSRKVLVDLARDVKNEFKELLKQKEFQNLYEEKKALIQDWSVWCSYFLGDYKKSEKDLMDIFKSSDISIKLCKLLIIDYRYFGLFGNSKNISKILLNEYEKAYQQDPETYKNELADQHIIQAMLNLEESYRLSLQQNPENDVKRAELLRFAESHILSVKDKLPEYQKKALNEILAYLYQEQGHPIRSYIYMRHLLADKLQELAHEEDECTEIYQRLYTSSQLALQLIIIAQYDEAQKIFETSYYMCCQLAIEKPQYGEQKEHKDLFKIITNFSQFCRIKILEITSRKGDFKQAQQIYDDLQIAYLEQIKSVQLKFKQGKKINPEEIRDIFLLEGSFGIYHMMNNQDYLANVDFKKALNHIKEFNDLRLEQQNEAKELNIIAQQGDENIEDLLQLLPEEIKLSETEKDNQNTDHDLINKLIIVPSYKLDIQLCMTENIIFNTNNLVSEYYKLQELGQEIIKVKGYQSLYAADFLRLRAIIVYLIKNKNMFHQLQIYQRKRLLERPGQEIPFIDSVMTDYQQILNNIQEDALQAKNLYKKYYRDKETEDFKNHPNIAWTHLILYEHAIGSKQLYQAKRHLAKAEKIFIQSYGSNIHTHLVYVYLKKSEFLGEKNKLIKDAILQILKINQTEFESQYKERIIKQVLRENPKILKILDDFYKIGFETFLVQNLNLFLGITKQRHVFRRSSSLKVLQLKAKNNNLNMTEQIDHITKKGNITASDVNQIINRAKQDIQQEDQQQLGKLYKLHLNQDQEELDEAGMYLKKALHICETIFGEGSVNLLISEVLERIAKVNEKNYKIRQSYVDSIDEAI